MEQSFQSYRDAIAKRIHGICFDRNLDSHSTVNTEAGCRIDRFLPELVGLARAAGPDNAVGFEAAVEQTVCVQCGSRNTLGVCRVREDAECCLYRYLPLIYEALYDRGSNAS